MDLLGALLEMILEILGEAVFEFLAEFVGVLILRGFAEVFDTSEFRNPWIACIGYVFLGGATGCLSLLVFPQPLFHPGRIPGLSLIVSPLLAGLGMWLVGAVQRKRNKRVMQLESFGYGFAFALGMAVVRFFFAMLP